MQNNRPLVHRVIHNLLFLFIGGFFAVVPGIAFADYGPSDSSQLSTSASGVGANLLLGNGFTGTVSDIRIKLKASGLSSTEVASIFLYAFTDSSYTNPVSGTVGSPQTYCGYFLQLSGSVDGEFGVADSGENTFYNHNSGCSLNSSYYYALGLGYNNHASQAYGGSTQIFTYATGTSAGQDWAGGTPYSLTGIATPWFNIVGASGTLPGGGGVVDTGTRFASTTPAVDAAGVATSTNFVFGAAGYVNPNDWNSSTVLYIRYRQITGAGQRGNGPIYAGGDFTLPIIASTTFSLTGTTTVLKTGIYQAYAAIQKPSYQVFGLNVPFFTTTVKAITWQFEVSTSTAAEQYQAKTAAESAGIGSGLATTTGATTGPFANTDISCSFLSGFEFRDCIRLAFVPTDAELQGFYDSLNSQIIYKAPWGYASLFFSDFTGAATGTLPSLTFNLADTGLTGSVNRSVDLTPWNSLLSGTAILATTGSPKDGKTLKDIVEPYWSDFVYLLLFLAVGAEIIGLGGKVISKI